MDDILYCNSSIETLLTILLTGLIRLILLLPTKLIYSISSISSDCSHFALDITGLMKRQSIQRFI